MKRLSRFLRGNNSRYVTAALAIVAHVMLGVAAWQGSLFALILLTVLAACWTVLAAANGAGWRRTTASWERSLEGWEETNNLAVNYVDLLMEACHALSTWDREQADEIISRTRTISALRQANFDERMGND